MLITFIRGIAIAVAMFAVLQDEARAQSPEAALASLAPDQQSWVNRSCPRSLGPSLWTSCVQREVQALKGGVPDLSVLGEADRAWIARSCPSSLGPTLAIACSSRELAAIRAGMPNLESLTPEKKKWVLQSCPLSLGPTLFRSCVDRESRALQSGPAIPSLQTVPAPRLAETPRPPARARPGRRSDSYLIETSHNDELFVINGEKFEAKTYCFNMEEDDPVIFLDGSPYGACASATLLNLRTRQKCEVWCE
jgi:hypothetical protein